MVQLFDPHIGDVRISGIIGNSTAWPNGRADGLPIGQVTPAAGSFTTLSSTGNATLGGAASVAGLLTGPVANGLTAGTTHSLAGATPLTGQVNILATVANASDAAALPVANAAAIGTAVVVVNNGAHAAAIWPQASDAIDGGSAGAAVTLTNPHRAIFYCAAVNVWISLQGVGAAS